MYDAYIYASYAVTFLPLALLVGLSLYRLAAVRAHLAAFEAAADKRDAA
jgi:heme exporter protein CcmD